MWNNLPAEKKIKKKSLFKTRLDRHLFTSAAAYGFKKKTYNQEVIRVISMLFFASTNYASTLCPRSDDPFYVVTYYIKWVTTSTSKQASKLRNTAHFHCRPQTHFRYGTDRFIVL